MKKHIQICIDDSPTSFHALDYVAHLFGDETDVEFLLFHCHGCPSAAFPEPENRDHSLTPDISGGKLSARAQRLLQKARQKLELLGVASERITTACQPAGDTAATICQFGTKRLVDSIVISRRGLGVVGELILGSVSSTLFDKCRTVPLWIIDGEVRSKKILVPVDGTPPSLMAIDHLAYIFSGRSDVRFYLFHVRGFLGQLPVCQPEAFYDKWGKDWCDTHLSGNGCLFTGPADLLADGGIPRECIVTLPVPTAIEGSTAIIGSARKNGCGTIVIGRRAEGEGKSILGGISKRTILQTENLALWVIG